MSPLGSANPFDSTVVFPVWPALWLLLGAAAWRFGWRSAAPDADEPDRPAPRWGYIAGALTVTSSSFGELSLAWTVLATVLVALTAADLRAMVVPRGPLTVATVTWLALTLATRSPWLPGLVGGLTALAFGSILYWFSRILFSGEGYGIGDVKLGTVIGLYLDLRWPQAVLLAAAAALVYALVIRQQRGKPFPFVPWLALGTVWVRLIAQLPY